jgi:hypothetical protein
MPVSSEAARMKRRDFVVRAALGTLVGALSGPEVWAQAAATDRNAKTERSTPERPLEPLPMSTIAALPYILPPAAAPARGRLVGPAFRRAAAPWVAGVPQGLELPREAFYTLVGTLLTEYFVGTPLRDQVWFDDDFYYLPSYEEIKSVLDDPTQPRPQDVANVFDCEDYAYLTKSRFALHRLYDSARRRPSAFACSICWGENLAAQPGRHALNVVFGRENVYFVDQMPPNFRFAPVARPRPPGSAATIVHLVV